jgi:hypothetical protein
MGSASLTQLGRTAAKSMALKKAAPWENSIVDAAVTLISTSALIVWIENEVQNVNN